MKNVFALVGLFLALAMFPSPAPAAVPQTLVHTGHLSDAQGKPVDATLAFGFTLFTSESGDESVWTEEHADVVVKNGAYTVTLGQFNAVTPELFFKYGNLWLEISVGAQKLLPRQKVSSVPFALVSHDAIGAIHPASVTVNGKTVIDTEGKWTGDPAGMAGVQQIDTTAPLYGGPITNTGAIGITKAAADADGYLSKEDWTAFGAKQTRITGLCPNGQCAVAVNSDGTLVCEPCAGGVSKVDTGSGLTGGPITGEGTISLDKTLTDIWYVNTEGDVMSGGLKITPAGGFSVGTDQLVCLDTGNVGIGTATPAAKLHVAGDATIGGDLTITGGGLKGFVQYAEDDTETQSQTTTWVTKISLTLEQGTYLVNALGDFRHSSDPAGGTEVRIYNTTDTAVMYGPVSLNVADTTTYQSLNWLKQLTLTKQTTVALQFRSTTGALYRAYMKMARLKAERVD
ncbi:MAG: hypothetical protein HY897_17860 [Deltaproteobacteria bacterium]|nr:hypothetical protein [Deltaproteobacteria bacterium]